MAFKYIFRIYMYMEAKICHLRHLDIIFVFLWAPNIMSARNLSHCLPTNPSPAQMISNLMLTIRPIISIFIPLIHIIFINLRTIKNHIHQYHSNNSSECHSSIIKPYRLRPMPISLSIDSMPQVKSPFTRPHIYQLDCYFVGDGPNTSHYYYMTNSNKIFEPTIRYVSM